MGYFPIIFVIIDNFSNNNHKPLITFVINRAACVRSYWLHTNFGDVRFSELDGMI